MRISTHSTPPCSALHGAVIFLRATHAELTRAGYADLDPQHRLFLEYRPKEDEEPIADVSIFSPRYRAERPLLEHQSQLRRH